MTRDAYRKLSVDEQNKLVAKELNWIWCGEEAEYPYMSNCWNLIQRTTNPPGSSWQYLREVPDFVGGKLPDAFWIVWRALPRDNRDTIHYSFHEFNGVFELHDQWKGIWSTDCKTPTAAVCEMLLIARGVIKE